MKTIGTVQPKRISSRLSERINSSNMDKTKKTMNDEADNLKQTKDTMDILDVQGVGQDRLRHDLESPIIATSTYLRIGVLEGNNEVSGDLGSSKQFNGSKFGSVATSTNGPSYAYKPFTVQDVRGSYRKFSCPAFLRKRIH
jgi:hypothetical protein